MPTNASGTGAPESDRMGASISGLPRLLGYSECVNCDLGNLVCLHCIHTAVGVVLDCYMLSAGDEAAFSSLPVFEDQH